MLHAFAELQAAACELWLIVEDTNNHFLKNLIYELGIKDKVRVFGSVNNPIPFLLKANCLVLCSDYEGSPNVIAEALACKLPVIATDCDYGPRELLSPRTTTVPHKRLGDIEIVKHGILVPVGKTYSFSKAMRLCIDSPQLLDSFTKLALDRVLPLDIEKNIETYVDLF
ncbi:glycosyltransferase [Roseivirga sp.]|uniref:glycosyltransferase n=1 Tax=Roseivirga sp. TaxID=1964215 RepID=UPI003B8BA463